MNIKSFILHNSISPGNVMTPLWEELAGQTENSSATIKEGENAQVSVHNSKEADGCNNIVIIKLCFSHFYSTATRSNGNGGREWIGRPLPGS